MSRIQQQLTGRENLVWAWEKSKRLYESADGAVDWASIAAFELDLERQLNAIAKDFTNLTYRLTPLILLPQPKKPDEEGNPRLRQSFHLAVRDQVAWNALINVIGPILDSKMPPWVYGHRLYKAAWFEQEGDEELRLALGPYRHSTGALYRKFKHSWPLFRRHVSLTARRMVNAIPHEEQLDPSERSALNYEDRPAYLSQSHWPSAKSGELHYVSIDLEKFYPSINRSAILRGLWQYLPDYREDEWLRGLIARLLKFSVSRDGSALLGKSLVEPITRAGPLKGIPTGLMVAGFLSNVAMLRLDRLADRRLRRDCRIAQFRFVDDHAILAYDFDELRKWIEWYESQLARLGIGPKISATKFDPIEMAKAYRADAKAADQAAARARSEIDGRHPSHLMTKTLALVSELASADFDTLSAHSKGEKLNELEWLLLADLPDREIRADTRAAFAAGRIASLVPLATTPSIELLRGWRELARLESKFKHRPSEELRSERDAAREIVKIHRLIEFNGYTKRVDHYFKLMFQALLDHPDKPRLFIRVLDYCRSTGHSGTGSILKWLWSHEDGPLRPLAAYLRPLAIQTIARHVVTASNDLKDGRLLERQRRTARRYLLSLTKSDTRLQLKITIDAAAVESVATIYSASALRVSIALAADAVAERPTASSGFRRSIEALREEIGSIPITAPSMEWRALTGYPLGVWSHWLEGRTKPNLTEPSAIWLRTAASLDPRNRFDWQNLRKGLRAVQLEGAAAGGTIGLARFRPRDAGLILDHLRTGLPVSLARRAGEPLVVKRLRRHLSELAKAHNMISLENWVGRLGVIGISNHDPRRSEWTALEILRQLLASITTFDSLEEAALDELHPSNVLLPRRWLEPPPAGQPKGWTWETWRYAVRTPALSVKVVRYPIADYRRQPLGDLDPTDTQAQWRARLRGCGLLLLGLIAQDFRLPASWNVRGLERDIASFVRATLEQVPMSSLTHAIIEAALLPRSVETAIMRSAPWAFFGARTVRTINDTRADPPLISGVDELLDAIKDAQSTLEVRQISVLDNAPRQLLPMNVLQLTGAAVEMLGAELEQ
ncbi:RNA-directed DNA polymerase [Mesorhizobium sp.]|uniref:RNA-directed DNA polymerase n=1 Tax=Mesorhizobium sp. TaxID=1871066 RepID=UPI000FE58339|nr:RNA-directed DNA polymerase [Mesorhizobium sp.]RWN27574.1 MAG: RNA-directed DNA polymerase [Mesorhizobium sp.]